MNSQLLRVEDDIAIDIVVLPTIEMMEQALALNQRFKYVNAQDFPLNTENCIPHITLGMGAISRRALPLVANKIALLAQQLSSFTVDVSGIYQINLPDRRKIFGLDFEKSNQLKLIHEQVMDGLSPYLVQPSLSGIDPIRSIDEITFDTIANFANQGAYQNYRPHITLGFGELNSLENITLNSTIEGLFICQLANYCTCARILKSFPFKIGENS